MGIPMLAPLYEEYWEATVSEGGFFVTKGDRQPVSFWSVLVLFHFVSRWRLGSLLFPCELGVFSWSIPTCRSLCAISLLSTCCTVKPPASAFTIFGVFCWVGLLLLLCLFCLDEDCNPGWGDCGRPLRRLRFVLLKMVNGYILFIGDWTIRSNSAWSKKNVSLRFKLEIGISSFSLWAGSF